jgi:hypothetical protein
MANLSSLKGKPPGQGRLTLPQGAPSASRRRHSASRRGLRLPVRVPRSGDFIKTSTGKTSSNATPAAERFFYDAGWADELDHVVLDCTPRLLCVDFAVGFDQLVKICETILAGDAICPIHVRTAEDFDMAEVNLEKAVVIDDE